LIRAAELTKSSESKTWQVDSSKT